jgi:hypothetical protein
MPDFLKKKIFNPGRRVSNSRSPAAALPKGISTGHGR